MISVQNLHKSFDNNAVLRGVDLMVEQGQSLVVIGGSGTGKSVLLKCILGLEQPDAGQIIFDGQPLTDRNRHRLLGRFGMLFQGAALFDSLPVWENVTFRLMRSGMSKSALLDLAVSKLAKVGLGAEVATRLPAELSGGMQKRVGLARAIATDPDVIFFDEPTTGLDPIKAGVINRLIRDVTADIGATTITITHDMTSVHAIADRVAMLHDGVVKWQGSRAEMRASDDAHLQQFIAGNSDGPISTLR